MKSRKGYKKDKKINREGRRSGKTEVGEVGISLFILFI
jgi:hypothetical protein